MDLLSLYNPRGFRQANDPDSNHSRGSILTLATCKCSTFVKVCSIHTKGVKAYTLIRKNEGRTVLSCNPYSPSIAVSQMEERMNCEQGKGPFHATGANVYLQFTCETSSLSSQTLLLHLPVLFTSGNLSLLLHICHTQWPVYFSCNIWVNSLSAKGRMQRSILAAFYFIHLATQVSTLVNGLYYLRMH